jgi:ECF transporter S component (folate family)
MSVIQPTNSGEEQLSASPMFRLKGVFSLRHLVVMGVLLAFATILASPMFTIYLTPTFKAISFSYLPGVLVACMFGPWAGCIYGFAIDTLGYVVNPVGGYFPGYALSEMVTYFVYALLLFGRKPTLPRIAIARLIVVILVHMGLNFLWMWLMYGGTAGAFYTGARLINNLVQFPFHVALTWFVLRQLRRLRPIAREWVQ